MKISQAVVANIAVLSQCTSASFVETLKFLNTRDIEPQMRYDLSTISTCTWWYDNYEGLSCTDVRDLMYAISPEDFSRWNPSITLSCGNWQSLSYCVQVKSEQVHSTATSSSATSTTTPASTTSATAKPTLLGWDSLGCYVDQDPHTLSNKTTKAGGSLLTVEKCEAACISDEFLYAGVKAGTECWCGSYVSNEWASDQTACSTPCGGQSSEICGGAAVMNIYKANFEDTLPPPSTTEASPISSSATTTTTRAITTTTAPAATATPTWQALGCYKDTYPLDNRTLKDLKVTSDTTLTIASCQAMCKAGNYLYAGVENGRECWCGNEVQSPTSNVIVAETDCKTPCTGDKTQTCGAGARVYLYEYVDPSTTAAWQTVGCYQDTYPLNARTLKDLREVSDSTMTIASCQATCKKDGYLYAGVENGRECWCGNDIQVPAANMVAPATQCSTPCTGDKSQTCGAAARVFLYKNVVAPAPWIGLGCYGEEDDRILRNLLLLPYTAANMTRQNCINTCDRAGYAYAGLQYAQECWCDNLIHPPGTLAVDGAAGCNSPCSGNAAETCGGTSRVDVYVKSSSL